MRYCSTRFFRFVVLGKHSTPCPWRNDKRALIALSTLAYIIEIANHSGSRIFASYVIQGTTNPWGTCLAGWAPLTQHPAQQWSFHKPSPVDGKPFNVILTCLLSTSWKFVLEVLVTSCETTGFPRLVIPQIHHTDRLHDPRCVSGVFGGNFCTRFQDKCCDLGRYGNTAQAGGLGAYHSTRLTVSSGWLSGSLLFSCDLTVTQEASQGRLRFQAIEWRAHPSAVSTTASLPWPRLLGSIPAHHLLRACKSDTSPYEFKLAGHAISRKRSRTVLILGIV